MFVPLARRAPAQRQRWLCTRLFLCIAAISDTEPINSSNVGRECGVSSHTVRSYFEILIDTL